jgi:F0F1-type ATP synthase assembly protein I
MEPGEQGSDQDRPRASEGRAPRSGGLVAAGAGLQFAVSLLVFVFLGQWLDRRLGTAPVFLLGCVFVGAGGSFYAMYRTMTAAQRREDEERARRKAAERGGTA